MIRFSDRPLARLALLGAFAAALALTLAGCGRKGALDPPPSAAVAGEQQAAEAKPASTSPMGQFTAGRSPRPDVEGGIDNRGRAIAPKNVPDKRIPLDNLLN